MSDNSEEWLQYTPPELKEAAEKSKNDLLPSKSAKIYETTYHTFVQWKRQHKTKLTSESIMMPYFNELSQKYKPSTLWSTYSMLKTILKIKEKVDIDTYHTLKAFMRKQSSGFTSKKSNVLSSENVEKFLSEAPDSEYLATKVALIFGIAGACRSNELVNIKLGDIKKQGDLLVVNLPITKTKKPRTFVIAEEFTKIVQQYVDLRPENLPTDRFFVNFRKDKCTSQVMGIHKFSKMPKEIAVYLKLDDPASYTGHAFRRTSATLLADSGANITTLKRHGGWKSSNVAEGYIEESIKNKSKIGNIISMAVNFSSAEPSKQNTDAPSPQGRKAETITSEKENFDVQLNVGSDTKSPPKRRRIATITSGKENFDGDSDTNSPTTPAFVFKNCTVNIHHHK